jgi:hypothetical protein
MTYYQGKMKDTKDSKREPKTKEIYILERA